MVGRDGRSKNACYPNWADNGANLGRMVGQMPKKAKELTALGVSKIKDEGLHAVGGVAGLYLQIKDRRRSWIFRVRIGGKDSWVGLGGYPAVSLAQSRDKARELQKQVKNGVDPIVERQKAQAKAKLEKTKARTFRECAEAFVETNRAGWVEKHALRYENSLALHVYPIIGSLPVAEINTDLVLEVLQQLIDTPNGKVSLWNAKTDTASRLRGRIESVLHWARFHGLRTGENPADWKLLKYALPSKSAVQKEGNFAALPYAEIGLFMQELQRRKGMAARALEFAILTATRSGEVRLATWDEIDMESRIWIIPAEHMKKRKEHYVPLSDAAVKLLESLPRHEGNDHIFPPERATMLSDMALLMTIRRMHETQLAADGWGWIDPKQDDHVVTVHGFRSAFRDWAGETTGHSQEVIEHALAHRLKDKTEAAYQRGTLLDKRRALMSDWARYCMMIPAAKGSNVVSIRKAV